MSEDAGQEYSMLLPAVAALSLTVAVSAAVVAASAPAAPGEQPDIDTAPSPFILLQFLHLTEHHFTTSRLQPLQPSVMASIHKRRSSPSNPISSD